MSCCERGGGRCLAVAATEGHSPEEEKAKGVFKHVPINEDYEHCFNSTHPLL